MVRRGLFGLALFAVTLLPMFGAWQLTTVLREAQASARMEDAQAVRTPNPNPEADSPTSGASALGPVDCLVAVEPWFAGTIFVWLLVWLPVLGLYAIAGAALWEQVPGERASALRRPCPLFGIAFVLGALFATPWFYGLYLVLTQ